MTDQETKRRRVKRPADSSADAQRIRSRRPSPRQVALRARQTIAEITDMEAETVTSIEREGDGTWKITVDLLEVSRIPKTDDMLGSYEVELDEQGELLGYRRVRRYTRSQAEKG